MPRRKSETLTDVELELMQIVWEKGEVSTDEMQRELKTRGRDVSDGTIRKFFSILRKKGYVLRRRQGREALHRPNVEREAAARSLLRDFVRRAFDGSATQLVASLLDSRAVRKGDLETIKKMIAEHEKELRR